LKVRTRAGCLAAVWTLTACAPTLDWREFRPDGVALTATFPCKPDGHARVVPLAGVSVKLTLHACQAGDATWAVTWADMQDPARVAPALRGLRESSEANFGAQAGSARPLKVPGATPQPDGGRWALSGRAPDGRALNGEVAVFARGTVVFQATTLSFAPLSKSVEAFETFFTALRLGS
jgi:hypothetical protein